jgi:peptidoglycan-associated lipoprotein
MRVAKTQLFTLAALITAMTVTTACSKKTAKVTPPPPPPPAAPTVSLEASPSVIQQGQSTTLTWHSNNAQEVTIAGLGPLPAEGSRQVTPDVSTTYTAVAKGPGGSQEASARVTVNAAAATQASSNDSDLFAKNIQDVFFDYDKYSLRADQSSVAQKDASFLAQHPDIKVLIEGHCDDRGSDEYNLALGASRAEAVKQALENYGIAGERIKTVSLGKERPFCNEQNDQCWQENRRDHFAAQ